MVVQDMTAVRGSVMREVWKNAGCVLRMARLVRQMRSCGRGIYIRKRIHMIGSTNTVHLVRRLRLSCYGRGHER